MPSHNLLKTLALLGLASVSFASNAEPFSVIESKPISEVWLNPGFYSFHFDKDKGLNDNNFGPGIEYRYSTTSSITVGAFDNSDNQTSRFVGWYWQPLELGPARLGVVIGALDGYPKARNGGWFPAAIPAVSMEYKMVGTNILIIPGYKDRLYGAISVQVKVRVF